MSNIIVPDFRPPEVRIAEAEAARRGREEASRKAAVAALVASALKAAEYGGEDPRARVRALCQHLLNSQGRLLVPTPMIATEVARLVSDAVLGPGEEYEVKT